MKRILCVVCSLALCAPLALGLHAAYGEEFAPDASVKAPAAMTETAPSLPQAPENSGLPETPTTRALEASEGGMSERQGLRAEKIYETFRKTLDKAPRNH